MVLAKLKSRSLLFSRKADCTKWTYDYDVNNRLTSIVHTGGGNELYRTTMSYDVFNRRIKEVEDADGAGSGSSAAETRFSYDRDAIWVDLDNSNALKVRYTRGDDGGLLSRVKASSDAAWYYADLWGSTRQQVNASGSVQNTVVYDAFGNIQSETNASFGDRWKWGGYELAITQDLYYFGEYYNSHSGNLVSHAQFTQYMLAPNQIPANALSYISNYEDVEDVAKKVVDHLWGGIYTGIIVTGDDGEVLLEGVKVAGKKDLFNKFIKIPVNIAISIVESIAQLHPVGSILSKVKQYIEYAKKAYKELGPVDGQIKSVFKNDDFDIVVIITVGKRKNNGSIPILIEIIGTGKTGDPQRGGTPTKASGSIFIQGKVLGNDVTLDHPTYIPSNRR